MNHEVLCELVKQTAPLLTEICFYNNKHAPCMDRFIYSSTFRS
jgi:hypothetical protein